MDAPLAHNTQRSGDGTVPVIIEHPDTFPFEPGEQEREWHVASEAELTAYFTYWNAVNEVAEGL